MTSKLKTTLQSSDPRCRQWCQQLQQTWHDEIPISEVMGIQAHQYVDGVFETRAALDPNLNLHGTMFAGSVYSLATLTGWGLVYLCLKERGEVGDIVLADGQIRYFKPLHQQPAAVADKGEVEGDFSPLQGGKKARITVKVKVKDGETAVAEFNGLFVILPRIDKKADKQVTAHE